MIRIFRGRETLDKEKFIYDRISEEGGLHTVLVPDQYTLAAERQAMNRMESEVLLDVEISSITRLGSKVLSEVGDGGINFVNKYGRHMLLTRILSEKEGELQIFGPASKKESFVAAVNDFISGAKQFEILPQDLSERESQDLLGKKMQDLRLIYEAYEKAIEGKLTDTEDLLDLYIDRIPKSRYVRERSFWLYGFDSFTPKNQSLVMALAAQGINVNIMLTYGEEEKDRELFALGELVKDRLAKDAEEKGIPWEVRDLRSDDKDVRALEKAPAIKVLEEKLFNLEERDRLKDGAQGLTLVQAANPYNEAESAAAFVLWLLREKKLRYREIVVICNDQGERASIIDRVFQEYGLDVFSDKTRPILSSPIAIYITGLIEVLAMGYRTGDVFRVLKTGLTDLSPEEIEELENYALSYGIKGTMWKKPFTKGVFDYGQEQLDRLDEIRQKAMEPFAAFEEVYKGKKTTGEFIYSYYDFLAKKSGLGEKILELAKTQRDEGYPDLAEETLQIWGSIMEAFQQIEELIGDEKFKGKDLLLMLESGLSQMEVGVLPPTSDDILLGNMQRTRVGDIKALIVVGANDGLLPLTASEEVLFSNEEMERLREEGKELGLSQELRHMEENLAIYRNLSKAEEELYMSYSLSDGGGDKGLPSQFFERIRELFPEVPLLEDVLNREDIRYRLGGEINTLRHYTEALKDRNKGEKISGDWMAVEEWLEEKKERKEKLQRIKKVLSFDNVQKPLPKDLAMNLFHVDREKYGPKDFSFSSSRLEKYSRCPFSHFVQYGLNPKEYRIYTAAPREIGELYHDVLMEYSLRLNKEGSWDSITKEESDLMVETLVEEKASSYRDGLFNNSNSERYWLERAKGVCNRVCWNLVEQMRAGTVEASYYEEAFGKGRVSGKTGEHLPPIVKEVSGGTVYIEGRIDRLDLLPGEKVKIIDYKTGHEVFRVDEAASGYRLQLMLYLQAAMQEKREPAGVFYFLISDPRINAGEKVKAGSTMAELGEQVNQKIKNSFKLNGIMVDDSQVVKDIAGDFEGYSDILPLRKSEKGISQTGRSPFLLSKEDFQKLQKDVDRVTGEICEDILSGKIDIHPKRSRKFTPCTYCSYRGICRFDLSFKGCRYIEVGEWEGAQIK